MLEALNLNADEEAVYLALLDRAQVPAEELADKCEVEDAAAALASLEARGLVAADPEGDRGYRATPPQAMVHEALRDAEQTLAGIRASVGALSQRLVRGRPAVVPIGDVECIADGQQALARVAWWRDHARTDLRIVDPIGPDVDGVVDVDDPAPAASPYPSGVDVRGIYPQTALDRPDCLEAVKWSVAHGEQARTLSTAPVKVLLVDSAVAILPARPGNRYRDGAIVVRQPMLLDALVDYFEALWAMAMPLDAYRAVPRGYDLDADDRTLLSLMAAGFSDQTIGRRLGVGETIAQRRVARVIERLGAENRFQAGVEATRRGLI